MSLITKLKALKDAIISAIAASSTAYQELKAAYDAAKARIAELETESANGESVIDEISLVINPTAAADAIVKAADASPVANTPAVDAAIAETVGTETPTSDKAVSDALEMLASDEAA
jgi:hypothetical protein